MTNSVGDQTPVSRKEVLVKYLQYYDKVWSDGNVKVCSETQVTDEGRRVLLTEEEPRKRFSTLDLYPILQRCVRYRDCQRHIHGFIKAAELLEMICVNLFLFPWKKEIKTLKTFTGHFVYYIKPILPIARNILQIIGYSIETDTEYRLADNFDPDIAKRMGFDLFLARLESEYLLELMSQRSHAECLEIFQKRAAPMSFKDAGDHDLGPVNDTRNLNDDVFSNEGHVEGSLLVNPEENEVQGSLKMHNPPEQGGNSQDGAVTAEERPSSPFLPDDKSILEMQENYPDLAIRQKPIFRKQERSSQHLKAKQRTLFHDIRTDMSGPQSITMHTETTSGNRKSHIPNTVVETQPSDDKPMVRRVGSVSQGHNNEGSTDCLLRLTEQMGKLQMKDLGTDEPLKYPIEETAQAQPCSGNNDLITTPPTKSPIGKSLPILCNPSQEPVCNITGCGTCAGTDAVLGEDNTIKEPPQSIYIPSSLSGCSPAVGPPTDHSQTANEGSNVQLLRSPTTQQPEEDLENTYVMV